MVSFKPPMPDSAPSPSPSPSSWGGLVAALLLRALLNPRLAVDLLRTAWAFRRRDWWRAAPFLPVPDPEYLRWRMYTAYGEENAVPPLEDVIAFARWRRETMRL
jgi:hypothetical protein